MKLAIGLLVTMRCMRSEERRAGIAAGSQAGFASFSASDRRIADRSNRETHSTLPCIRLHVVLRSSRQIFAMDRNRDLRRICAAADERRTHRLSSKRGELQV